MTANVTLIVAVASTVTATVMVVLIMLTLIKELLNNKKKMASERARGQPLVRSGNQDIIYKS